MKDLAIITGATSGIGLEFTKILAKENIDVLLIARNREILKNLKNEYSNIKYIAMDLSCDFDIDILKNEIGDRRIKFLINNAGFGDFSQFECSNTKKNEQMINLNIKTLTNLTHLFLTYNKDTNEKVYLLNVGSIAGFMPGPLMAVYYATKSYVISFTKAIRYENKNKNICISVLCPGATTTNFVKSSNLEDSNLFKKMKTMSAYDVAKIGYKGLLNEKEVIIPGFVNKLAVYSAKLFPSKIVTYFTYQIMKRK